MCLSVKRPSANMPFWLRMGETNKSGIHRHTSDNKAKSVPPLQAKTLQDHAKILPIHRLNVQGLLVKRGEIRRYLNRETENERRGKKNYFHEICLCDMACIPRSYKLRWFVLNQHTLSYYKREEEWAQRKLPLRSIDLRTHAVRILEQQRFHFALVPSQITVSTALRSKFNFDC